MGTILSSDEGALYRENLQSAVGAGWDAERIARELVVSPGMLKNMMNGHLPPSQKHVDRLNQLLLSPPPKRVLPPPPSQPVVTPPAFSAADAARLKGETTSTEQVREETVVETTAHADTPQSAAPTETAVLNGHAKPTEDPNDRYRMLTKSESKMLRGVMQQALTSQFGGSMAEMARQLKLTSGGLRKVLLNKQGAISMLTRRRFEVLAKGGHVDAAKEPEEASPISTSGQSKRSPTKVRRGNLLPDELLTKFREELREEMQSEGSTRVSREMGTSPGALRRIVNGEGSTYQMLEKFRFYKRGPAPRPTRAQPSPRREVALLEIPEGEFDLYALAGRALGAGRPDQAHLLSMIARVSEAVPLQKLNQVLSELLPTPHHRLRAEA